MKATIWRPSELDGAVLECWRRLQRETPTLHHPFLTPEFASAVGQASKNARVAVVEDAGETVGFLAYDRHALGVAKPIGGRLNYRQGFVHADGLRWSWADLMHAVGIHGIEFTDLLASQAPAGDDLVLNPSPIIDTSIGWDAYLEQVRRHHNIKKTLKRARRLEREHGPISFTWGPVRNEEFAQMVAWKSEQYRSSGWPDPFARPWIRGALDALIERNDGDLKVISTTLRAGEDLLAVDMSLISQDVLAAWFSSYNREFADYSPGGIRRLRVIERACNEHLAYVDLARGDEPYKESFKNAELHVATGLHRDRSPSALLYRSVHAPYKATRSWVLRNPSVRAFVRTTLRRFGSLRVNLRPHGLPEHPTSADIDAGARPASR